MNQSQSLSAGEQEFVLKRKKVARKALEKLGIECTLVCKCENKWNGIKHYVRSQLSHFSFYINTLQIHLFLRMYIMHNIKIAVFIKVCKVC